MSPVEIGARNQAPTARNHEQGDDDQDDDVEDVNGGNDEEEQEEDDGDVKDENHENHEVYEKNEDNGGRKMVTRKYNLLFDAFTFLNFKKV